MLEFSKNNIFPYQEFCKNNLINTLLIYDFLLNITIRY